MMTKIKTDYNSRQSQRHFTYKEKILGQFWTPLPVAEFMAQYASQLVAKKELAIDPACGDGIFLQAALNVGFKKVVGIDIDANVKEKAIKVVRDKILIQDGLKVAAYDGTADLVIGNPPYSAKYGLVKDQVLLKNYRLSAGRKSQSYEILFLEKFLRLAKKESGIISIILPMGIFANLNLRYVRTYLLQNLQVIALVSLPRKIFRSAEIKTTSKTIILFGRKTAKGHSGKVLMILVEKIEDLMDFSLNNVKHCYTWIEEDFLYPEYYINRKIIVSDTKLGDIVKIKSGYAVYGEKRKFGTEGKPLITAKNVTIYGIDWNKDYKLVPPGSVMDKKTAYVSIGDIVFVRVGVGSIGKVAVITSKHEEGIADDWTYILKITRNGITPEYLTFYLLSPTIQEEIRRLARGVGTITIPQRHLATIPFIFDKKLNAEAPEIYKTIRRQYSSGKKEDAKKLLEEFLQKIDTLIKKNIRAHNQFLKKEKQAKQLKLTAEKEE